MKRWTRGIGLAGWLLAAVLGCPGAKAQVATTTVQDTVMDASGVPATGTVVVSWVAFTTAAGVSVPAGSLATTLGAGGLLSLGLIPNAGATPMGSYYTAVYHLSDGTTSREFWVVPVVVPGGGTAKLAGIRNQVLPTSVALQTVSKQYVDTTVAKAMAGVAPGGNLPYVLKTGDTLTGPLTLAGDPVQATQAADKHYVDASVAAIPGGMSGAAGGDLSGTFPNPAVRAVHATGGTLDGVTIGASVPAAGNFNQLSVTSAASLAATFSTVSGSSFPVVVSGYAPNLPVNGEVAISPGVGPAAGQFAWFGLHNTGTPAGNYAVIGVGGNPNDLSLFGGGKVTGLRNTFDDGGGNGIDTGIRTAASFHETLTTPASSTQACSAGDFTDDANFHYVCVTANVWKRAALSSF